MGVGTETARARARKPHGGGRRQRGVEAREACGGRGGDGEGESAAWVR